MAKTDSVYKIIKDLQKENLQLRRELENLAMSSYGARFEPTGFVGLSPYPVPEELLDLGTGELIKNDSPYTPDKPKQQGANFYKQEQPEQNIPGVTWS